MATEKRRKRKRKKSFLCYLCLTPVRNLIGYLRLRMIGDTAIHSSGDYGSLQSVLGGGWGWHLCCYSLTQLITSCIESWVRETGRVSGDENKQYSKQHTAVALTTCFSYGKLFVVKHYILQCKFNKWTVNIMFPFQLKRDEETKKQLFTVQHKHSIF